MSKRPGLLSLVWVTMNDTQDGVGGHSRLKTETSERFTVKIWGTSSRYLRSIRASDEKHPSSKEFISVAQKRAKGFHLKVIYWMCWRHSECFLPIIKRRITRQCLCSLRRLLLRVSSHSPITGLSFHIKDVSLWRRKNIGPKRFQLCFSKLSRKKKSHSIIFKPKSTSQEHYLRKPLETPRIQFNWPCGKVEYNGRITVSVPEQTILPQVAARARLYWWDSCCFVPTGRNGRRGRDRKR